MKLIAHRGNLTGANSLRENDPIYIQTALDQGYDCEIDLRMVQGKLYLGHDYNQYPVDEDFLKQPALWIHCKDSHALAYCLANQLHCFWHEEDAYTLTSLNIIWAYPGQHPIANTSTVLVMPERSTTITDIAQFNVYGICSDMVKVIDDARI
jgi:hypothetical protein